MAMINRNIIFQTFILEFYVKFWGCNLWKSYGNLDFLGFESALAAMLKQTFQWKSAIVKSSTEKL